MKINDVYSIVVSKTTKTIDTNLFDDTGMKEESFSAETNATKYKLLMAILEEVRNTKAGIINQNTALTRLYKSLGFTDVQISTRLLTPQKTTAMPSDTTTTSAARAENRKKIFKSALDDLINFFSDFLFTPSYRFVNSLAIAPDKLKYVKNYFEVMDYPYKEEIKEKIKSPEFNKIINILSGITPKPINTRFELFYGDPGSGKTTTAWKLTTKHIVCSSDMLPKDLMQNFLFKDGKPDFDPSDLWKAMENGESILLDEVNMLPFESLRFLQGITDGKDSFDYVGYNIKIDPKFKIYATMNLNVNGQCIPLPAPLVDRAYDIKEFKLTAEDLLGSLFNNEEDNAA